MPCPMQSAYWLRFSLACASQLLSQVALQLTSAMAKHPDTLGWRVAASRTCAAGAAKAIVALNQSESATSACLRSDANSELDQFVEHHMRADHGADHRRDDERVWHSIAPKLGRTQLDGSLR